MLKRLTVLLLSLCTLCGAALAMQPGEGSTAKEQKALQKAQKKKLRREARHFESLRNEAVEKFARGHQPSEISTPSFINDFRISNVICAGDNITGTVMLHFDITPLYGGFRLYMGGERNGIGPPLPKAWPTLRPTTTAGSTRCAGDNPNMSSSCSTTSPRASTPSTAWTSAWALL